MLAQTLRHMGRFKEALAHADAGIPIYDRAKHHVRVMGFIVDVGVHCLSDSAHALWALGYPDRARARLQEMLAHARTLEHPFSLAWACMSAARRLWIWREDEGAGEELEEGSRSPPNTGSPSC
jgi:hypothetical protein